MTEKIQIAAMDHNLNMDSTSLTRKGLNRKTCLLLTEFLLFNKKPVWQASDKLVAKLVRFIWLVKIQLEKDIYLFLCFRDQLWYCVAL